MGHRVAGLHLPCVCTTGNNGVVLCCLSMVLGSFIRQRLTGSLGDDNLDRLRGLQALHHEILEHYQSRACVHYKSSCSALPSGQSRDEMLSHTSRIHPGSLQSARIFVQG